MKTPDDNACEASLLRLQRHQIAYAGFIESATIVSDEHVSGACALESFKKYVDAAGVTRRQDATSAPHPPGERSQTSGSASHLGAYAKTRVGEMRGGRPLPRPGPR